MVTIVVTNSVLPMSDLLRASQNEERDKLMVRHPLEVVWYIQRMHPSRTALTAC